MKFSVVPPKADQRRRWSLRRPATGLIVRRNTYNTTVTPYYKNAGFTWWERLPAANIVIALCRHRLSRLEAAPTKVDTPVTPKCRFSNNLPHYIISVLSTLIIIIVFFVVMHLRQLW
jgi:hypothetical protein